MVEFFFVYGTLMSGYGNNCILTEYSTLFGKAETCKEYALFCNGIPFVNEHVPISKIKGEVWRVTDQETINIMDDLEGHPEWYYRKKIPVLTEDGIILQAWIYFNHFDNNTYLQEHGDYRIYTNEKKKATQEAQDNLQRSIFFKD